MSAPIRQQDARFSHNIQRSIRPLMPRIITEHARYRPPNSFSHQQLRGQSPNFRQLKDNSILYKNNENYEHKTPKQNPVNIEPQSYQTNYEPYPTNNFNKATPTGLRPRIERPLLQPPRPFHNSGPDAHSVGSSFQNRPYAIPNKFHRQPAQSDIINQQPPSVPTGFNVINQNLSDANARQIVPSAIHRFPFPPNSDQPELPTFVNPPEQRMLAPPPPIEVLGFPQQSNEEILVTNKIASRQALMNHRNQDHAWLERWLKDKNCKDVKPVASMSISEAHQKTQHMILLMARLQKNKALLESMEEEDKLIWDQKVNEVSRMKQELEDIHREVTDPAVVADLKHKIQQRRKKRERLKRRRQAGYQARQQELEARNRLHKDIDAQQEKIAAKQLEAKQEADMKEVGDTTLAQVKKKMGDNSKMTQVFSAMRKLRQLRKDRQERQGLHWSTASHDHVFESRCESYTEMLTQQNAIYKTEEAAIKVILETEHEETREKEREISRRREEERRRREEKKVQEMLFGNQKEPLPDDPLYPFTQYYDAARHSLDALISIRHEWDRYLASGTTTGASCIPHTWVLPPDPSSDPWAEYLHSDS